MSDRVGLNPLDLLWTIVTAVACFTFWGLSHDLALLDVFSLFRIGLLFDTDENGRRC